MTELPSMPAMRFAGLRAAGLAAQFFEMLKLSDVPKENWEEVANRLLQFIEQNAATVVKPAPAPD